MTDHQPTILVVDDDENLLFVIAEILRDIGGYTVVTAKDGATALAYHDQYQPDCMVVDVRMPYLDGLQLVRAIRGDPTTTRTPMVILSALAQDKDQYAGIASGVDVYLIKPAKPQELIAAIQTAIARTEDQRATQLRDLAENE